MQEGKGFIRATQVGQILRTMGQAFEERDLKQLIREFDSDGFFHHPLHKYKFRHFYSSSSTYIGSGEIEFEEFAAMVANFVVSSEDNEGLQQELREAFRLYDKEAFSIFISNGRCMLLFFREMATSMSAICVKFCAHWMIRSPTMSWMK